MNRQGQSKTTMATTANKRIAKNTLFLYFRMLVIMAISFYTTRVVLECLGVNDYGIYNVVGGIVGMFAIFSSALTGAVSRFITYEIGRGNSESISQTFSASITILVILSAILIVVVEPLGVWFLNVKMKIAPERLGAANWVLQCSIITFIVSLLSIPYTGAIIAYERMQAFAYISLVEAGLKLGVALLLKIAIFDSLKLYAVLLALVSVVIRMFYGIYTTRNFPNLRFRLFFDKLRFKQILSFTGWTFIGGGASILNGQGINILLNIFFGTVVNAARGIAMQVNTAVGSFSANFMLAVNPQIIKSYAAGDLERTMFLVFQSARMALFLMLVICVPMIVETEQVLRLWLKDIPDYSIVFVKIVLLQTIFEAICMPLQTLNQASGKVKWYQIIAGGVLLVNFPLSWAMLKLGMAPQSVFYVALGVSVAGLFARGITLKVLIDFDVKSFLGKVLLPGLGIGIVCFALPLAIKWLVAPTALANWTILAGSLLWTGLIIYCFGLTSAEKQVINSKLNQISHKICRR